MKEKVSVCQITNPHALSLIFCTDSDSLITEMENRMSEFVPQTIFAMGLENGNTIKVFILYMVNKE